MEGDFLLTEPCEIELETAVQGNPSQPLDAANHKPIALPAGFQISADTAVTIGRVQIRQGVLQTFRYPGTDDTDDASIISELKVNHSGMINIRVKTPTAVKTIKLDPGTEIAIVNDSADKGHDHFHIYEKLGHGGTALAPTPKTTVGMYQASTSKHRIFKDPNPIVDGVNCPNTGCCVP